MRCVKMVTMTTGTIWKAARRSAGRSLADAEFEIKSRLPRAFWLDRSKLSRFESDDSARVDPVVRSVLADCYGVELSAVDPEAAADLDRILEVLRGRGSNSQPTGYVAVPPRTLYIVGKPATIAEPCRFVTAA